MCSRASLGNWNVWVHGVQEDPLHPIAVEQQRNWVVASGSTRFKRAGCSSRGRGGLQTDEKVLVKEQVSAQIMTEALNVRIPAAVCVLAPLQQFGSYGNARGRMRVWRVLL